MIEFDETFTRLFSGKEAIKKRVETRLKHNISDIPYYSRGVDYNEFTYGSQASAIQQALRDFSPDVVVDIVNSRVQVYDVIINVDKIL